MSRPDDETYHTPEGNERNSPGPTISKPCGTGVKAGPVPVVNDHETSTGADGSNNDYPRRTSFENPRRKSFESIISISSTSASETLEISPLEAAVRELNRIPLTPNADAEPTTSTNMSANNPDQPTQVNTAVEATVEPPHQVHQPSAEPAQVPELRADYLATIAQNGLRQNLGLSDSVPPGTAQQPISREDNTHKIPATYADFNRMSSVSNPASHTTTIPPRAEESRNAFKNQSQPPPQNHAPRTPLVDSRPNNPAIPPRQPQPQPQPDSRFVPIQPNPRPQVAPIQPSPRPEFVPIQRNPRPEVVQKRPTVQSPGPRHLGPHMSVSGRGAQGTAPHTNHHGVSEQNRPWGAVNEASRSQAPHQPFSPVHPPSSTWRAVNGIR